MTEQSRICYFPPMSLTNLTAKQLRRAAAIKEKIASLEKELSRILGGAAPAKASKTTPYKKRKISAAGRARIRAAQKARWAKIKAKKK